MATEEDIKKFMATPVDISQENDFKKSSTLALHFIGYLAKPIGISEELYQKCLQAFNNNRGKTETEAKAIFDVLTEEKQ